MGVWNDDSARPARRMETLPMRFKIATLATVVAVVVLLYVYLIASGFSVYSDGISLRYHVDPDATREDVGVAITRVTDDDLTGIPQVKHMLDLALEHGPVMRGDDFVALDNYLNSYRVSGNPISGGIEVSTDLSPSDMNRHDGWIDANLGSSYFEYEGKIFSLLTGGP